MHILAIIPAGWYAEGICIVYIISMGLGCDAVKVYYMGEGHVVLEQRNQAGKAERVCMTLVDLRELMEMLELRYGY